MVEVIIKKSGNKDKKYDAVIDGKRQFLLVLLDTVISPNTKTRNVKIII